MLANRDKIEAVADAVIEQKEIYGDDLVRLLDAQHFVKPRDRLDGRGDLAAR